jgi:hypothetical protein
MRIAYSSVVNWDMSGMATQYAEAKKIVDKLKLSDTISADDFNKLKEFNKNIDKYFTQLADTTY